VVCASVVTAGEARSSATATLELILTGNEGAVAVSGRGTCRIEDTRNNGRPCSFVVNEGDDLTLTPQGSGFVGWSVFECPGTGACTIDVDSDRTVVATYTPTSLSVSVEGSDLTDAQGNLIDGRVTSADGRIDCSGSDECRSRQFPAFSEVVLTASPASEFERWSGACQEAGTAPTCTVLLSGNDVVGAKFRDDPDQPQLIPPRMRSQLRVAVEPAGSGTVNSSRSRLSEAITCNPTCKARFEQGEKVTLEAVANSAFGARFVGWQGGAPYCAAGPTCRSFPAFNITSIRAVFAYPGPCERRRHGTRRRDLLDGGPGGERLVGGAGNDRLRGMDGDDCLEGGAGNDRLEGGNGNDRLSGGMGNDSIDGGPGNDAVFAREGRRDTVRCGSGRDSARVDRIDTVSGCEQVRRG
jgi:RTX calcium-binding nonapeptide repeat (4 copies)/Divergent InlB B-repeat domain